MKIATILFTYNRPRHAEMVLKNLSKNTILPDKLYIFHDGKKDNTNKEDWNKVENIIRSVNWCNCDVITSDQNKGLADSVVFGINYVFEKYDAVIVLEDDCVPHRLFMEYMTQSLSKYERENRVYCINASSEPVDVPANGSDAYFMGRINSCGWATWKDRWQCFDRDYRIVGRIKKNREINEWHQIWTQDVEETILSNIYGDTDSWAAFWALAVINRKGLCLAPYESFIDNIGFDGSGVHSGIGNPLLKVMSSDKANFILPDKVEVVENYEKIFANYYPWTPPLQKESYYRRFVTDWLDINIHGGHISEWLEVNAMKKISIWGSGKICDLLLADLGSEIEVVSIVETNPKIVEYHGIPVASPKDLKDVVDAIVVIPGYDLKSIKSVLPYNMRKKLVPIDVLGGGKMVKRDQLDVNIKKYGNDYGGFYVCEDFIASKGIVYSFGIGEDLSFSKELLDNYDVEIYAFDPTPKAAGYVKGHDLSKHQSFHFKQIGLSDVDEEKDFYLPENEDFVSGSEIYRTGLKTSSIKVKMKSINTITKELNHTHINILKMDIEGSEFKVIHSLNSADILIDQICVEVHDRFYENGRELIKEMDAKLHELGYRLAILPDNGDELTYINQRLLKNNNIHSGKDL